MAGKAGTVELIVLELGRALGGLKDDLAAGGCDSLIGQTSTTRCRRASRRSRVCANALPTIVTKAGQLPALSANLSASINADGISIGADGAALIAAVQALVNAEINQVSVRIRQDAVVGADPGAAARWPAPSSERSCSRLCRYPLPRRLSRRRPARAGPFWSDRSCRDRPRRSGPSGSSRPIAPARPPIWTVLRTSGHAEIALWLGRSGL